MRAARLAFAPHGKSGGGQRSCVMIAVMTSSRRDRLDAWLALSKRQVVPHQPLSLVQRASYEAASAAAAQLLDCW